MKAITMPPLHKTILRKPSWIKQSQIMPSKNIQNMLDILHVFPSFLSRFRNLKAYMLSLGNIETAPLTPHRLEGKDWIDALALYMPPLRCPTDPALLLLRTRGYGVTAPRRRRIRKRFDRDVARHYYEAVVIRTSNNKPASHGRQAPFSGGFGVI